MKKINEQLKTLEFNQVYLLYGSEGYLKKQYRDKLAMALTDIDDTMNYNYYEGNKINVNEILDIGDTLPFFQDRRVIVIENSGWFKKTPEDMEKRMENFPDSTYVIFVENEVDKRSRLYKWVNKNGYVSEMKTPSGSMLVSWVLKLCRAEGKEIEKTTIQYLVQHTGSDMMLLKNELDKLFGYCADRPEITVEDVQQVCVSQAVDKLFQMLDAIASKDQKKALLLYHDLLVLKEPAMRILYNLTNYYKSLMELSGIPDGEYPYDELASLCGIPVFSVKKNKTQASRYSFHELRDMVELCQITDQKIKTGRIQDIVGVELLIVDFSS